MTKWPVVQLRKVIQQRKDILLIDDFTEYKRCRVQLHAQGIVLRDTVPGADIKTKKQQSCKTGDFLVAEIDAKVGGFGIVPGDLDGAIVSSHYFLFEINEEKLNRSFLDYFIRTPAFREQVAAQGSTNYAAIRPNQVLEYEIPLPPLPEQRRIVARIEELASKINQTLALRQNAMAEAKALINSARRCVFGEKPDTNWIPLSHFVAEIENGKSPQCESRPATSEEWGVLKVGAVSFGSFDERENKALPVGVQFDIRHEVRAGDFLMSRANTTELVGACAIVSKTRRQLLLSDKTFRFHFRSDYELSLEWLDHAMKSPAVRAQIEREASGTSPTMKNISKEKVMSLLIPPLPLTKQRSVLAELNTVASQLNALQNLQAATAAELASLLPLTSRPRL
jgi:type I restriction enzyme S subunit